VVNFLESLALEEQQSFTIFPHMSVNQLLVAALVFLSCTISQAEEGGRRDGGVEGKREIIIGLWKGAWLERDY